MDPGIRGGNGLPGEMDFRQRETAGKSVFVGRNITEPARSVKI
jgi:hypothetical protein